MVSIHVPLAEHDESKMQFYATAQVSIHVPLAEHDLETEKAAKAKAVSIHVPLAEHDFISVNRLKSILSFNSRAPRGARHVLFHLYLLSR